MRFEGSTRLRLEPRDEGMHANRGEPHYNESMYFNFFDPERRLGGFARIGNRPNEAYAEVTLCLFQPDGSVLFHYARPPISGNEAFAAGGMHFEVEKPFERLSVGYDGSACHLREPLELSDPRTAFAANPFVPVRLDLAIQACGPTYGGEPERRDADAMEFAHGHYEQHHRASGWVEIEGRRTTLDGFGLRDHSWGPRHWQAPAWYRWLTANFGADFGLVGSQVARPDGSELRGGFVYRGSRRVLVRDVEIDTEYAAHGGGHERIHARLHCADGKCLDLEGVVSTFVPLRNRRAGRITRIGEGLTEWRCEGRVGYGLSEYLDQGASKSPRPSSPPP